MEIEKVSFGPYHWARQAFISEIDNDLGNYYVAFDKDTNKLIGYFGFWLIFEEAHITTIAVHPEYRGNNIGELLLQKMIDTGYSVEAKWFTLEVRESNFSAQSLYYKYKFKSLGLRHKYYQENNENAIIMWTENIWDSSFKTEFQSLKDVLLQKQTLRLV